MAMQNGDTCQASAAKNEPQMGVYNSTNVFDNDFEKRL